MATSTTTVEVVATCPSMLVRAQEFAAQHRLSYVAAHDTSHHADNNRSQDRGERCTAYRLVFASEGISLQQGKAKNAQKIAVDFCEGANAHRRKFGGGKSQMIAKAVGVSARFKPSVLDATAGLGADAFVLASLGCKLTLFERSPIAHLLLDDGLSRARICALSQDPHLQTIIQRMSLVAGDALEELKNFDKQSVDIVYLDPMFPQRKKSAEVKKQMQAFHHLIGQDLDAVGLLDLALRVAHYRVVVKRPRTAPHLGGQAPTYSLQGKSSRFDIYALRSIAQA